MNYYRIIIAAATATAVMTAFMLLAPFIGLPNMNAGVLIGKVFGGNEALGWVIHCAIGCFFVLPYVWIFNHWIPVENKVLRGLIYGILVFFSSELVFTAINLAGFMRWDDKENMSLMLFGNALGCMIYGVVLGLFFERVGADAMEEAKREP